MISSTIRRLIALPICVLALSPNIVEPAAVYKSQSRDGTVLFSDAPVRNGQVVRQSYRNSYGREMTTMSCLKMTHRQLERRGDQLAADFSRAAERHRVDPLLLRAITRIESCFDPRAVSVAGARGLMQLMPATAYELGVLDSFNVAQNLDGGAAYIARMLKRFDHDHRLALAAYNAGPGAVERHGGVPPYRETQRYVNTVLQHYRSYARQGLSPGVEAASISE